MLKKRSNKQALMAESSFLSSPRFFNNFLSKNYLSDSDSPTSILDSKNSSSYLNPFDRCLPKSSQIPNHSSEAIGLALIDSIIEEKNDGKFSKPVNRMALFGSKLKVQIPVMNNNTTKSLEGESPKSPADFGIKTRNSQLVLSPFCSPAKDLSRQLSLKEMEMSEDYTCVITHGPNPKTTHIFDDCIVECCCDGDDDLKISEKGIFGNGKDVCNYRGEKGFSSHECCCKELISEMKKSEMDEAL